MTVPRSSFLVPLVAALLVWAVSPAHARVELESICSVDGQKELRLTGVGLVVGLDGTGDGDGAGPSVEALARALDLMGNTVVNSSIKDADNIAIVMLEATIPAEAVRVGQRIDVYVSSILSAESLRGGRLLVSPLMLSDRRSKALIATASGGIAVEGDEVLTTGRIPGGAIIEANLFEEAQFLRNVFRDNPRPGLGKVFTLRIDPSHASYSTANNIADAINGDFRDVDRKYGRPVARAIGPGVIEVTVPAAYRDSPVEFVANVLEVGIDRPHTQARVVVNTRAQVVVVTGEVALSPVTISHPSLQIDVAPSFRALTDPDSTTNNTQLRQLVAALGQLQVPTQDVINIVRELHASGKLHATYVER